MAQRNALDGLSTSIIRFREEHKMTQSDFAHFIGQSSATVKRWESRTNGPNCKDIVEIADRMGLTVDELLRGVKPQDVDINKATGLSSKAIETLRQRDDVISYYVQSVIEPLIENDWIASDILAIGAIYRKRASSESDGIPNDLSDQERYMAAGIRMSILEHVGKLIDEAASKIAVSKGENELAAELMEDEKKIELYREFHDLIPRHFKRGN